MHDRPSLFGLLCFFIFVLFPLGAVCMQADAADAPAATAPFSELEQQAIKEKPNLRSTIADRGERYSKRFQSELGIYGGDYLGDEWLNTWDAGAHYYLHLNNTFAVGTNYTYSRIRADSGSSFGTSLRTKDMHIIDAEVMISNDCAFRAGKSIIECDLFMTLGGGAIWINREWKPMGVIGGGIKIFFTPPWVALRFDVNTPIHPTPKPGGDSINADVMFNLGVSFFFPIKRIEPEEPL